MPPSNNSLTKPCFLTPVQREVFTRTVHEDPFGTVSRLDQDRDWEQKGARKTHGKGHIGVSVYKAPTKRQERRGMSSL